MLAHIAALYLLNAAPTAPVTSKAEGPEKLAADSVIAAAFKDIGTQTEKLKSGETIATTGLGTLWAPMFAIAALTVGAIALSRRKRQSSQQYIKIIESVGIGPKRSLVVAQIASERLVLGVSEAGIVVISTRAAPAAAPIPAPALIAPQPLASRTLGFFERMRGTPSQPFDAALLESIEDQELRDKLASGMRGVIK